jgi:cytoplasmic tRNA 2-thiolation protein 1
METTSKQGIIKNLCEYCQSSAAKLKRSKNGFKSCLECFYVHFEDEIHNTIVEENLFAENDHILLAISGGKDSTVLLHVMTTLKERHKYPISLELLAIDEGIKGYRDDSLTTVKQNSLTYNLPLKILSYKELYGISMDEVVEKTGVRCSCTYCGVFRRRALDIGLVKLKGNRLFTGHNADDIAETILMNILRGDAFRLVSCTEAQSGAKGDLIRCKPFKFAYEKEIVLYAHYKKLDYFSTECTYAKEAYRGHLKELIKKLVMLRPGIIEEMIRDAQKLTLKEGTTIPTKMTCKTCGSLSSNEICKVCLFKQQLESMGKNECCTSKKIVVEMENITDY